MASNYTDSFAGDPYYILKGEQLSAAGVNAALNTKEKVANKVTTINNQSTDAQYPSAKVVYDALSGTNNDIVHKAGTETITGVKTFGVTGAPAEPLLGVAKTAAATNSGTKFATEAQVFGKQNTIAAGTAKNIVAYSGTAGTFDTLTRAAPTMETDTTKASDDKIPTEKAVATALAGKLAASDLTALDTKVTDLETTVSGLQEKLPIGTILMFNGIGWQDDVTRAGWYRCIADNVGQGVPDLESRFILGSNASGSTGGSNALTAAMLPQHTHSIYTDATKDTARTTVKTLTGYFGSLDDEGFTYDGTIFKSKGNTSGAAGSGGGRSVDFDATHEHTGGANNDNSTTTDSNTYNMPAYYTVIYIMRVR
ncbi:MAG: hypothetical protein LBK68_04525 [Candidatus Margulisbacteria bacterium]|jgi:hypothetical protein|nr:hypothetical protein [Candidatus Margulisiibacteriota bacterium]